MMHIYLAIALAAVLASWTPASQACSFGPGFAVFEVDQKGFEHKFDTNDEFIAFLPAPKVLITNITRGTAAPGSTCADAGIISVDVYWPEASQYELDEIGFYFRTQSHKLPDLIFPLEPVAPLTANISGNRAAFTFVWLDGHPDQQIPLDFELEVFAVNKGMEIGPPAKLRVAEHAIDEVCITSLAVHKQPMPQDQARIKITQDDHDTGTIQISVPHDMESAELESALVQIGDPIEFSVGLMPQPFSADNQRHFIFTLPFDKLADTIVTVRYDAVREECKGITGFYYDYTLMLADSLNANDQSD